MRLIALDEYEEETMQLARPIYDRQRRVLLGTGRKIHPKYLERLEEMDLHYIFVDDAVSEGITMEELMDMPSWMEATEVIQTVYEAAQSKKPIPLKVVQKLALKLTEEVSLRKVLITITTKTLDKGIRDYAHPVNVALLSLQIGRKMSFNSLQLRDLTIGALLHDIGKVIEGDQDHSTKGFELLRKESEINLKISHVAFQHHEKLRGGGTPRGIEGADFHEFAQIVSAANMYENLMSKENISPYQAVEMIMAKSGIELQDSVVRAFVNAIAPYPPGTQVLLSNGEQAIVTKVEGNMQRPFVREFSSGEEYSLSERYQILITKVIEKETKIEG